MLEQKCVNEKKEQKRMETFLPRQRGTRREQRKPDKEKEKKSAFCPIFMH